MPNARKVTMSKVRAAWRERPGMLLAFYLALAWLPFVIDRMQSDIQDTPWQRGLGIFALLAFFAWRVSRGGTISWTLLMLGSAWGLFAMVMGAAAPWTLAIYWQVAFSAVQLALLFSPAIRRRLGGARPTPRLL